MSIVPKETIEVIAQSVGIPSLGADVSAALAPDVEYRLREIMQVRPPCSPLPFLGFNWSGLV
jgi:transcription initiation factor TFIID subunit 6